MYCAIVTSPELQMFTPHCMHVLLYLSVPQVIYMGVCVYTPAFALNAGTKCFVGASLSLLRRRPVSNCAYALFFFSDRI